MQVDDLADVPVGASVDVARGWCRVMGLTPMSLFLAAGLVMRNLAIADAFQARRAAVVVDGVSAETWHVLGPPRRESDASR